MFSGFDLGPYGLQMQSSGNSTTRVEAMIGMGAAAATRGVWKNSGGQLVMGSGGTFIGESMSRVVLLKCGFEEAEDEDMLIYLT